MGDGDLALRWRIGYNLLVWGIVVSVAVLEGYFAWTDQNELIHLQASQTCGTVFDAVQKGWSEVRIFTETLGGSYFANKLSVSQQQYSRLGETQAVGRIAALKSLQFVRHLEGMTARQNWEQEVKDEFRGSEILDNLLKDEVLRKFGHDYTSVDDFYMFGFGFNETQATAASGKDVWDPIIYQTAWDNWLWGFFPDPEPPRIQAISTAISTGRLTCSGRIDLFGIDTNPSGLVCFLPLFTSASGEPRVEKESSTDKVFGFVNPLFQMSLALDDIFNSEFFDTDIADVDIFVYDTSPDDKQPNEITGNLADSFLGKYPMTTKEEFNQINQMKAEELLRTYPHKEVQSRNFDVAERQWTVYCGISDSFYDKRTTNIYILLGLMSVGITVITEIIQFVLEKFMHRAQVKVGLMKEKSRAKIEAKKSLYTTSA